VVTVPKLWQEVDEQERKLSRAQETILFERKCRCRTGGRDKEGQKGVCGEGNSTEETCEISQRESEPEDNDEGRACRGGCN